MYHLQRVANIVKQHGGGDVAIAAAWLHDIIEDCGVAPLDLLKHFDPDVVRTVVELTDDPRLVGLGGDWRQARQVALARIMGPNAAMVKCADVIDNAPSMRVHKPDYFDKWALKKRTLLWNLRVEDVPDELWREAINHVRPDQDNT